MEILFQKFSVQFVQYNKSVPVPNEVSGIHTKKSAVDKARTLMSIYEPNALYNDRVLCIPPTLNKNEANSTPINLDSLDEQLLLAENNITNYKDQIENIKINQSKTIESNIDLIQPQLTPNPSNGSITIKYNCKTDGKLEIYNQFGQIVQIFNLEGGNKRVETEILNIAPGIYNYKFSFGKIITNGKLTIIK